MGINVETEAEYFGMTDRIAELVADYKTRTSQLSEVTLRMRELEAENAELRTARDTAYRIVCDFARRNPIHEWAGVQQDPYGAHAWLELYNAAMGEK